MIERIATNACCRYLGLDRLANRQPVKKKLLTKEFPIQAQCVVPTIVQLERAKWLMRETDAISCLTLRLSTLALRGPGVREGSTVRQRVTRFGNSQQINVLDRFFLRRVFVRIVGRSMAFTNTA